MPSTMDFPSLALGMDFGAVCMFAHSIESFLIPIQYFYLDHEAIVMIWKLKSINENFAFRFSNGKNVHNLPVSFIITAI